MSFPVIRIISQGNDMSKSIMQRKEDVCYLCKKLYNGDWHQRVEEHHIVFGTANRRLSEHYGLKVYLCDGHHEHSPEAVHQNNRIAKILMQDAQKAFQEHYPDKNFEEIFGQNYLEKEEAYGDENDM